MMPTRSGTGSARTGSIAAALKAAAPSATKPDRREMGCVMAGNPLCAGITPSEVKSGGVFELSRRSLIVGGAAAAGTAYAGRGRADAQAMTKIRVAVVAIDITAAVL